MTKQLSAPDQHQLRICMGTVKNPAKGLFLGGPSAEEAEKMLREKFGFSDNRIYGLKLHGAGQRRRGEI